MVEESKMKIDMDYGFKTIDGKEIKAEDASSSLNLGMVCINSLLMTLKDDRGQPENLSGKEKLKMYDLSMKMKDGGMIDLTTEEIVLIKDRVGKAYNVLIVGQAFKILEGND